jgi:RimJ/RimL family protein N-acetyltransferase
MIAWRSNPEIYNWMRTQDGPLSWEGHLSWFGSRPSEREDWIIRYNGRRVGVVAVAADGDIGVFVGETDLWGEGLGTAAVREALNRTEHDYVYAEIHEDNMASRHIFDDKLGFDVVDTDGEWIEYELQDSDE